MVCAPDFQIGSHVQRDRLPNYMAEAAKSPESFASYLGRSRDTVEMRPAVKRMIVGGGAKLDELLDGVLYRPAVVKAFRWMPRWWLCDLAKLSMALDDRWDVGYWEQAGIAPGEACDACGRRASIHVVGGVDDDVPVEFPSFLDDRPVFVCGWCQLRGVISSQEELEAALAEARQDSVSWRWRWRVRG